MKGNLYFRSCGQDRLVKENIENDEKLFCVIHEYVKRLNPNFEIYYIRSWQTEDGITVFDVGSHTEFFKFKEN